MRRNTWYRALATCLVAGCLALAGCAGDDGSDGRNGTDGTNGLASLTATSVEPAGDNCANGGQKIEIGLDVNGDGVLDAGEVDSTQYVCNGVSGDPGTPGTPGTDGSVGAVTVAQRHGEAFLQTTGEFASSNTNPKYLVDVEITDATAGADGVATVDFTVGVDGAPVTDVTSISAGIFKLVPASGGVTYNQWVPYLYRAETVSGTGFPEPDGTEVNQGYRESSSAGTLVNHGDGSYTYTFGQNLSAATLPVGGAAITYDRALTHRVSVYMGGHSGATGEADFDFVPDGSAVTETRNIVQTSTCQKCHGPEFAGHGGDRTTVEGCNTCHSPATIDAQSGESLAMAVMIHKIHAGNELASVAGPDGHYYDNPWTAADETADNGTYILWGHNTTPVSWENAAFPAVLANCQACHTGTGEDVENWNTVPSREACGSCHDLIDWATGANHAGGVATSDSMCAACHPSTGDGIGMSVTSAHDWTVKDIRNIPEFDVDLTVSTPANGTHFVAGETPVIHIALTDSTTGAVVSPASVVQDDDGSEGCVPVVGAEATDCTVPRDGKFASANVYVTGPRGQRIPVLTTPARVAVASATAGPWDVSGGGSLTLRVDSGLPLLTYNNAAVYEGYGAEELIPGEFTVTLAAGNTTFFADNTAATPAEVAAWLAANATFHERAIAYVDESTGTLSIRTRGVLEKDMSGEVVQTTAQPNIEVVGVTGLGGMFAGGEFAVIGRSAAQARIRTNPADTDPKADFTDPTAILYTLDPVDDLMPGTYVINVEFADASRGPGNPPEPPYVDYRTPSVAVATFQVKQADEEAPIAGNCTACHWSDAGVGFVLDYPRHHKIFNEQAVDQCGGCHDYAASLDPNSTTAANWGGGGAPISKRVHAVHNGAALNYPTLTVGHEETHAFGRNWRITYPMDVRNCESCHPEATTSGTWMSNPNRLACMGCHDSDAASAHMELMTWDPTPLVPWSGDEEESCAACH